MRDRGFERVERADVDPLRDRDRGRIGGARGRAGQRERQRAPRPWGANVASEDPRRRGTGTVRSVRSGPCRTGETMTRQGRAPSKITIIRHGEKPPLTGTPQGVNEDGSRHASFAGRARLAARGRAGAVLQRAVGSGDPSARARLYAPPARRRKATTGGRSRRSRRSPSAWTWRSTSVRARSGGGTGRRRARPRRGGADRMGARPHPEASRTRSSATSRTAPQKWPDDRFDVVWVFDLQPGGGYPSASARSCCWPGIGQRSFHRAEGAARHGRMRER